MFCVLAAGLACSALFFGQAALAQEQSDGQAAGSDAASSGTREISLTDPVSLLHYVLTPAGEFRREGRLDNAYGSLIENTQDTMTFLDCHGKPVVEDLNSIRYMGDGLYTVSKKASADNMNVCGLVTIEGDVLIPCEAASIVSPTNRDEDGIRFVEVIYATDVTDNKDDCIVYYTDNIMSMSVGEDDTMYKGYAKIFDIQEGKFVDGLEFSQAFRNSFYDLMDSFVIDQDSEITMYSPDGTAIWKTTGYIKGDTHHSISVRVDNNEYIVDSQGNDVYKSSFDLSDRDAKRDLYIVRDGEDDEKYHLIDMYGKRLLEKALPMVSSATTNYILIRPDNKTHILLDNDGNVLLEDAESYSETAGAYGRLYMEDKSKYLITPAGIYQDVDEKAGYHLLFTRGDVPVILNTGENASFPFKEANSFKTLAPGLLTLEESTSSGDYLDLYDLFTGEQLLPSEYTDFIFAGGYVFACRTGSSSIRTWEVYKADLVPVE